MKVMAALPTLGAPVRLTRAMLALVSTSRKASFRSGVLARTAETSQVGFCHVDAWCRKGHDAARPLKTEHKSYDQDESQAITEEESQKKKGMVEEA